MKIPDVTPLQSALPVGSNARLHARLLGHIWESMLAGDPLPGSPRRLIADSWMRVRRLGVDPYHGNEPPIASFDEIEWLRENSRLTEVLDILRVGLTSVADDGMHIMVITDGRGRLLWREGSNAVRLRAEDMGFVEGASWDETSVGTNGIGTGLEVGHPVQIFAAEHFVRSHHPWVCTAAPLRDPRDGKLLGLVDVSGPASTVHPNTLALVDSVTRLAHASLRQKHTAALEQLRSVAAPVLGRCQGPAIVTDRHGWVAAAEGTYPNNERLVLPDSLSGGKAYILSLGWCQVEPLFGGWLIRIGTGEPERPTRVRLDLRSRTPYIEVDTSGGNWRHQLSPRHTEILLLLAANPDGRTAAQLSKDLFGDAAHTVTVRAEMSRLRRRLGTLLDQRPYRLVPWLELTCLLPGCNLPQPLTSQQARSNLVVRRNKNFLES